MTAPKQFAAPAGAAPIAAANWEHDWRGRWLPWPGMCSSHHLPGSAGQAAMQASAAAGRAAANAALSRLVPVR
jgi:hypothetical protein